mgnify:FL=1
MKKEEYYIDANRINAIKNPKITFLHVSKEYALVEKDYLDELLKNNNDWIKCSDRLPPVNEDGESCSVLLYGMETPDSCDPHQFIGYLMEGKFYCDDGHSPHQCYYVSHWQPLPPPPAE